VADTERKALALTGSGDTIFDWDVAADHVHVSPEIETQLGLARGALEGPAAAWLDVVHRPNGTVSAPVSTPCSSRGAGGSIRNSACAARARINYWFRMKARPVVGTDGDVVRIIGTLGDVTEAKIAEERLCMTPCTTI